ncbi:Gag Pol protein [Plakobranchus ocellatus]|uniref:Gag Pol protein n=1 Tax=Plakobranchus ocellatus TaxID=259542 RepID=A0AAV4CSI9_9GAST|nr:Gag Pol protein [Plakobranchus ocellatus]
MLPESAVWERHVRNRSAVTQVKRWSAVRMRKMYGSMMLAGTQTKIENSDGFTVKRSCSSVASQLGKVKGLLYDLKQLFVKVNQAFENCPEIEQVAVLFGGTVVSPKESYIIKFPPSCPDADSLSLQSCKRNLFQQELYIGDLDAHVCVSIRTIATPQDRLLSTANTRSSLIHYYITMAVGGVALKLQTFWVSSPLAWFAQAEAQFELGKITQDDTRYYHVVASLDTNTAKRALPIITAPPPTEKYKAIKDFLTSA